MTTASAITHRTTASRLHGAVRTGLLLGSALAVLTTSGCDSAEAEPIASNSTAGQTAPASGATASGDVKQAEAVLAQAAAAYKKAPGLTDDARLDITYPDGRKQSFEMPYAMGAGTDATATLMGMTVTSLDERAVVLREGVNDKYLEVPLDRTLSQTLDAVMPGFRLPPSFALRDGTSSAAYADSFGLGALRDTTIEGYEQAIDKTGRAVHAVRVGATNGNAVVHIDAKTNLLAQIDLTGDMPTGEKLKAILTFAPKLHESPQGLVTLATSGRTRVVSIPELAVTPIKKGDVAPDFTLTATDGRTVALRELRGKVVVLDFWATWCMPCRRGLPSVQKFDTWAREGDKPVAVFAVDTFERVETVDAMRTAAEKFWASQKFTMDNLLDFGNEVIMQYGYESIPTTVIIDPNGVVAEVHSGFDPNMFDRLKTEVSALMPGG